jgi:hypothetical protein
MSPVPISELFTLQPAHQPVSRQDGAPGGLSIMKKIIAVSCLTVLAATMLLPVARQVNAAWVNHSAFSQGPLPPPPPGGGH